MKKACVITGGEINPVFLKQMVKVHADAMLIVVDGALEITDSLGMMPDYIVGDFDTVDHKVLQRYPEQLILRHPPEKDQTDTELALETAISSGCDRILLFGATGSRIDHSLANIFLLQRMAAKNVTAEIYNETNKLYLKTESFKIKKAEQFL